MQNRYVGDIGDYIKLSILGQLAKGKRLGVAWWLFPDESHNNDGGHREYVANAERWGRFDPRVFEALAGINRRKERNVRALQDSFPSPDTVFVETPIPCGAHPFSQRPTDRMQWLLDMKDRFAECELIFLDPDNGIAPDGLRPTLRRAGKSVFIHEIIELQRSHRPIILYHHHSRFRGGHEAEVRHLAARLREAGIQVCGALRAKPWSPRAFFILDADEDLCARALQISKIWHGRIDWHPEI